MNATHSATRGFSYAIVNINAQTPQPVRDELSANFRMLGFTPAPLVHTALPGQDRMDFRVDSGVSPPQPRELGQFRSDIERHPAVISCRMTHLP